MLGRNGEFVAFFGFARRLAWGEPAAGRGLDTPQSVFFITEMSGASSFFMPWTW